MKGASPPWPLLSKDPWPHAPQDRTQPCIGERTGYSFPSPTTSLAHHNGPLVQPALTPFLIWLCRHVPANRLSLSLAFFVSFVSAVSVFLTTCFWCRALTFPLALSHATHHCCRQAAPMSVPEQHLYALAWCCLPPTGPLPTYFSSGWLASLLGV